jgi:hypothetical protein
VFAAFVGSASTHRFLGEDRFGCPGFTHTAHVIHFTKFFETSEKHGKELGLAWSEFKTFQRNIL